MVQRRILWHL